MTRYHSYIHSQKWHRRADWINSLFFNQCIVTSSALMAIPVYLLGLKPLAIALGLLFAWTLGKASHTHHLTYRNMGHELPVRDCVPLSKAAHWIIHLYPFWKVLRVPVNGILRVLALMWLFGGLGWILVGVWLL